MEINKKNLKNILLLAAAIVLIYQISDNVNSVLDFFATGLQMMTPFLVGLGIAFIINVPLRSVEGKVAKLCKTKESILYKHKRIISFLITLIFVFGVLVLIAFLVIPQLTVTIKQVFEQIPKFYENVAKWIESLPEKFPQLKDVTMNLETSWDMVGTAISKISSDQVAGMFNSTWGIVTGVVDSITTFVIAIVFACYILFQKEKLSEQMKKLFYALFDSKVADRAIGLARMADTTFSNFLAGQCMESVILGAMFVVAMAIFGMPYNVMIGVLIGVTALIPIVGAFIGCFVGVFLILMVNPMQAVMFVILFLVLQQIEGNLIYPKVVGNSVGLPAIWVLFAVTVGGNLMGVAGMIIGIPVVSMAYTLLARYVNVKLMVKNISDYKWRNKDKYPIASKENSAKKHVKSSNKKMDVKVHNKKKKEKK